MFINKIYIVLVNFKGHADTIECLESVLKLKYTNFQLIIVDNSPTQSDIGKIKEWIKGEKKSIDTKFPELVYPLEKKPIDYVIIDENQIGSNSFNDKVIIIKAKENNGFASANNIALKYALLQNDFEFLWLLNNDTVVCNDSLHNLVKFSKESNKKVGLIGSCLINYWNPKYLQGIGGRYYKWTGRTKEVARNKLVEMFDKRYEKIDYVIGASMFLKKDFITEVGLMNENLFLYYEELDWALRGKAKGWLIDYCLDSKVYHKLGSSTKNSSNSPSFISDFYSVRNRILINKKFYPISLLTLYPSFILFIINRIRLRMWGRIKMLFILLIDPTLKHTNY